VCVCVCVYVFVQDCVCQMCLRVLVLVRCGCPKSCRSVFISAPWVAYYSVKEYVGLAKTIYIHGIYMYMVCIRYCLQGFHHMYGHIRMYGKTIYYVRCM
jgi:hypothetical protein